MLKDIFIMLASRFFRFLIQTSKITVNSGCVDTYGLPFMEHLAISPRTVSVFVAHCHFFIIGMYKFVTKYSTKYQY